jgi:predicted glycosyltransferase/glycosyltransferase involved in cell wall biosynthesis
MTNSISGVFQSSASSRHESRLPGMKNLSEGTPDFVASASSTRRFSGKYVAAVAYSGYPGDPRPRRAAEALAKEGATVEVICIKEADEEPQYEFFGGVHITRIPIRRRRGGKLSYLLQYTAFILLAGLILARRACKRRYHLVHVHNMPDILVFSALVPKILRAKIILDLHDPMPELMMTIYGLREHSFSVWLLRKLEKWSVRFADAVLVANEAARKVFLARSCAPAKMRVIMNTPDEGIFHYRDASMESLVELKPSKPFVIMYHGTLVERHGLDLAVTALERIRKSIPNAELRIYGRSTPFLEQVMDSVRKAGLSEAVQYLGPKKLEQIPLAIGECDVGIIPNRRSIFTELNTPTRIFEFLSQGKPIIVPGSAGILDYFDLQELVLFKLGDADDLALKLEYVFRHPEEILRMVERAQGVYRAHKWSSERLRFLSLAEELLEVPAGSAIEAEGEPRFLHAVFSPLVRLSTTLVRHFSLRDGQSRTVAAPAPKIWIDLENTPHIPFFKPIIRELEKRNYKVVLTARDAFQTCEMATRYGLIYTKVGHHYGQNRFRKLWGLVVRSLQLIPFVLRERPCLGLNHGARAQILICNLLRIPNVMVMDYEHSKTLPLVRPWWEIVPDVVSDEGLHCRRKERIRKFSGIKEDVYVPEFSPDPSIIEKLQLNDPIIVTVRPPASEAHYHNAEADVLFESLMERICRTQGVKAVLLPRNSAQKVSIMTAHPDWFKNSKVIIPEEVVDGLNLLWHSDLAVSGGGTMNREAAALGVPVYSIFRGEIGAVDRSLQTQGRLVLIESTEDVQSKILLRRRARDRAPFPKASQALQEVVDHIDAIVKLHASV